MCSIRNIRLSSLAVSAIKAVVSLYTLGAGIYIASSASIKQAFGEVYGEYGGGLAFVGALSCLLVVPTQLAIRKHNKFVLLVCMVLEIVIFLLLLRLGYYLIEDSVSEFSKDLQIDCSRYIRQIYTLEECLPFFQSDRTAGFRLFWQGYFSDKSNTISFQVLSTIQQNACCGFFPPLSCLTQNSSFPSKYYTVGIDDEFLDRRVTCGNYPGYYPEQDNCLDYYDISTLPPIIGGCNYDLGVSYCLEQDVDSNSIGCVSYVEDYAINLILPHGYAVMSMSAFNIVMFMLACCMWWKRKEHDVFPAFEKDFKYNDEQYSKVREQFDISAQPDILIKEGFLPTKRDDRYIQRDLDIPIKSIVTKKPISLHETSSKPSQEEPNLEPV